MYKYKKYDRVMRQSDVYNQRRNNTNSFADLIR